MFALIDPKTNVVLQKENATFAVHSDFKWAPIPSATPVNIGDTATEANGVWTFTKALVSSVTTLADQARAALIAGLTITSKSNSTLDGTYPLTSQMQSNMIALEGYYNKFGTFPNKTTTLNIKDTSGTVHEFTYAEFESLFQALGDCRAALVDCLDGISTTLPSLKATIA